MPRAIKEELKTSRWSSWDGSAVDYTVNDGFASVGKAQENFILGTVPAINMLFPLLLNICDSH